MPVDSSTDKFHIMNNIDVRALLVVCGYIASASGGSNALQEILNLAIKVCRLAGKRINGLQNVS